MDNRALRKLSFSFVFFSCFACDRSYRCPRVDARHVLFPRRELGNAALKTVAPIDYAMIAAYMVLMLGNRCLRHAVQQGRRGLLQGREPSPFGWPRASRHSCPGSSAWTFTALPAWPTSTGSWLCSCTSATPARFLLAISSSPRRWRRARISTVMEYLVDRFDERTRQTFSWSTTFSTFFTGASMLYGVALFVAPTCGAALLDDRGLRRVIPAYL